MTQKLKVIIFFSLFTLITVTGCEIRRPAGEQGDISGEVPTAAPVVPATETPVSAAPTETPLPPPPEDIDLAGHAAPELPPPAVEPGKVMVKLNQQAAQTVQSTQAETAGPATGIPSLDERLSDIGVVSIEPVVVDVAQATGKETLSIQAEHVGPLFFVSYTAQVSPVAVAQEVGQDPAVEYAEPNFIAGIAGQPQAVPARFVPNDRYFKYQWNFQNIQMPAAWDISTGQGVVVAVVDTGIDFGAPDLANTLRLPGHDFVNNDDDPTDDQGHGTHVAGTIAQSTNNSIGVAGMAFNAQLLPVKVLNSSGNGSYENIIKGIIYATDQGAQVINMSLAGSSPSQGLEDAVKYANSKGVVVVAAAGNANSSVAYPAAYDPYVIAVGAVRFDNTRANYSNFGPELDLVAPGGDVDVDQNEDGFADGVLQETLKAGGGYSYQFWEGTSMASPHVAGLAALLLARHPNASSADIENMMASTALKNLGPANEYGAGLIQAANALGAISPPPITPTPTDTPPPQPPTNTPTPTATPTSPPPTDTPTSIPVCTAPACGSNEVLICPSGNCPTGCEVVCATVTPSPTNTPSPTDTPTATASPTPTATATASATVTATSTPTVPTPTSTPTATLTPTPSPPTPPLPAGELLLNGGFETDEGWVFGDTPVRGSISTEVVHTGSRAAKLGITTGPDRYTFTSVWQRATIPADAQQVTLTANIYPVSQESAAWDAQNIFILDNRFRLIRQLSRGLSNSQTWETQTFDLTDLRGQTIYVYFGVFNNGWGNRPTAMFVDDVSLTWSR